MNYVNKLKKLYRILGFGNLIYKLYCSVSPIFNIRDTRYRTLRWQKKCVNILTLYAKNHPNYPVSKRKKNITNNTIWILWLQGKENMPIIVKKCYESVVRNNKDRNIILLSENDISEYIEIPDFIQRKYQEGRIPFAQYSDLIRLELLLTYGGIWMDATVYMTDKLSPIISNSDLFFYQSSKMEYSITKISNWFILAKEPNNYILKATRDSLYHYLSHNKHIINQFIFHLMVTALYNSDPVFREHFETIPYVCNMNPHLMWFSFDNIFSEKNWVNIVKTSSVHKLSWKYDFNKCDSNSFAYHIINNL